MRDVVAAMRDMVVSIGKFARAFGLGIVGAAATIPVVPWVYSNANAWAAPFAIAGLVILVLSGVISFRLRKHSWLLTAPVGFGAALSTGLAMLDGWNAQIQAAFDIINVVAIVGIGVVVAIFIAMFVALWRARRADENLISEAQEDIRSDVPFRDDGERIEVYPARRKMLRPIFSGVVLVAFSVGIVVAMLKGGALFLAVVMGVTLGAFSMLTLALWLIRLVMWAPSLVIGPDGIVDRGSAIVTGRGLLSWNEVLGVLEEERKMRFATYHHLGIALVNMRAIRARQPLWKRPLLLLFGQMSAIHIIVVQSLLNMPAAQLAARIETYAREHAPPGSWHANWKDEPPVTLTDFWPPTI